MENIDLGNVIEEVISKFSRNRIGAKPPAYVTIPPTLRDIPWEGVSLKEFVLYETLLTNNPDAPLEVMVYRRDELMDLDPVPAVYKQGGFFMLIRKILCPTDLSANSKGGIDYAISLAREQRAELIIFHVTSFPWESFAYLGDAELLTSEIMSRFTVDDLLRDAESKVKAIVRTFFEKEIAGVPWRPKIGLGSIADEIVHAAMQEKVDIIVMAKRKRGALRRLFSRSISEQVSREAFCPVLSVCPSQIARPKRERKWPFTGGLLQSSKA